MSPTDALPLPPFDPDRASAALDRLDARFVECAVGDFTSIARGKHVARGDFLALGGCKLPSVMLGLTVTAGEPDTVFGPLLPADYSDLTLRPDLGTLVARPGRPQEASVLCEPAGRWWSPALQREVDASELSPRACLRRVLARCHAAGLRATVAPELEFFLLRRTELAGQVLLDSARATPQAPAREAACEAFSLERTTHFEPYFDDLYAACAAQGIALNGHGHEAALSQFEVNFAPGEPLAQADAVFRFKRLARQVASRHGFLASFAPKPFLTQPGVGMHWHVSLQHHDAAWAPVFATADGRDTPALGHFVAGLQAHAPAAMALFAPHDMAYDRIRLSDASPSHASWGPEDRAVAFRIPAGGPAARRVENRLPGGDANPYLALAVTLGLGLRGLAEGNPPDSGLSGAHALPVSLPSALQALRASMALRDMLGDALVEVYTGIKAHEHAERAALADPRSDWDLRHLIELA